MVRGRAPAAVTAALAAVLVAFFLISSGCRGSSRSGDAGEGGSPSPRFKARAFAGTELRVLANDHPWIHHNVGRIKEFTEATGITVSFDIYPEEQFRVKRTVEMLSGISGYDAFMIMPGNSLSEYHDRGWVENLDPYFARKDLAWPDFALDDIYPNALEAGTRDGHRYSLPVLLETSILAYNKRLFAEYGVAVPRTMGELERAARTVYKGSGGRIAGISLRGRDASATSQWADFLHSFGGAWVSADGFAAIDSPEALEALRFYGRLLRDYGPRDATRNGWYESVSLFTRGEAAMIFDANLFRTQYEDAETSLVEDEVGYAILPAGPAGSVPHVSHWALAINPLSRRKNAAWYYVQWASSRREALAAHLAGIPSARPSVWRDPAVASGDSAPDWTAASTNSYELATYQWNPPVNDTASARIAVGEAIVAAILDQDLELAAHRASVKLNAILSKERRTGTEQ